MRLGKSHPSTINNFSVSRLPRGVESSRQIISQPLPVHTDLNMLYYEYLTSYYMLCKMVLVAWYAVAVDSESLEALCYDYDGTIVANDTACKPFNAQSFCCGRLFACLDNGMCTSQYTYNLFGSPPDYPAWVRGSCTDPSWESSECPRFCIGKTPSGGTCKCLHGI